MDIVGIEVEEEIEDDEDDGLKGLSEGKDL